MHRTITKFLKYFCLTSKMPIAVITAIIGRTTENLIHANELSLLKIKYVDKNGITNTSPIFHRLKRITNKPNTNKNVNT